MEYFINMMEYYSGKKTLLKDIVLGNFKNIMESEGSYIR